MIREGKRKQESNKEGRVCERVMENTLGRDVMGERGCEPPVRNEGR